MIEKYLKLKHYRLLSVSVLALLEKICKISVAKPQYLRVIYFLELTVQYKERENFNKFNFSFQYYISVQVDPSIHG